MSPSRNTKDVSTGTSRVSRDAAECAQFLQRALHRNISVFRQLVFLANTRDSQSRRYHDQTLALAFGEDAAALALQKQHERTFVDWLTLGLANQTDDLSWYLKGQTRAREMVSSWIESKWYEGLIPEAADSAQRMLFTADLEVILPMLCSQGE